MSTYAIAQHCITTALAEAEAEKITRGDCLHALLVSLVQVYKEERGMNDTREALEFQASNLKGDEDFAFMRP